jgi:aryl carrier-like protein
MDAARIAALMSEMFETDVEEDDNFFEIGGNSLQALTLAARLEEGSGVKVSLLNVIRNPTPKRLADLIAGEVATKAGGGAAPA